MVEQQAVDGCIRRQGLGDDGGRAGRCGLPRGLCDGRGVPAEVRAAWAVQHACSPLSHRQEEDAKFAGQSYQGYAFEAYSTHEYPPDAIPSEAEDPAQPPGWSSLVNTNEQWCCVVKSGIEDVRLYMAGEVDCVEAEPGCKQGGRGCGGRELALMDGF